jgi:hypothetical protein
MKIGAKIMAVKNCAEFVNGECGVISGFNAAGAPIATFPGKPAIALEQEQFCSKSTDFLPGSVRLQYPVILAE